MAQRKNSGVITEQLLKLIPGGSHTYSRGFDQFPENAPNAIARGRGQYFWDEKGRRFLDFGMGLRSVGLGHAYLPQVVKLIWSMRKGNSFSRPSLTELNAAKTFLDLFENQMMVKFAKNGSNVTTAAVKLARAFTSRSYICFPEQQPFFSFDDWFIGSTVINRGTLSQENQYSLKFKFGNIQSLKDLFANYSGKIAAVIMEPCTPDSFCSNCQKISKIEELKLCNTCVYQFLLEAQDLCSKNGALLVLDEMITGFRVGFPSVSQSLGLQPDLITFGKVISNGFSVAALVGRPEIMNIASITDKSQERVFILSSTNGAESFALEALIASVKTYSSKDVTSYYFSYGQKIASIINQAIAYNGVSELVSLDGIPPLLNMSWSSDSYYSSQYYRTLFNQEMFKQRIFMPWIAPSFQHSSRDLKRMEKSINRAFQVCISQAENPKVRLLVGQEAKPVFRRFN
jgi:glutamate-1-semialdehyde 2,1-aminomutase